jgi:hypothetical protein
MRGVPGALRGLGLLVAIVGAGWVASPRPAAPPAEAEADAEAEAEAEALMSLDRAVALLATDLSETKLADAAPLPLVILYFSTSCPHCWNVAGEFQQACDALAPLGVNCIAIASAASRLGGVRDFAAQTGLTIPAFVDYAGAFRDANGMSSTPTAVYANEAGEVVHGADPFYRGAGLALRMAVVEDRGLDPESAWVAGAHVGSRACARCHETAYNSWLLSAHSVAIRDLPGDSHEDPACLRCHATATGHKDGFVDLTTTSHLRDVGCESCHGPSGGHTPAGMDPARPAPRDGCSSCHDDGHGLAFDLDRALPGIDHQLAETLPREQWGARRLDIEEGRAPRTALAIPDGDCTGSASCEECHVAIHAAWAASPHGRARSTLVEAGSGRDPACLACHVPESPCETRKRREPGVPCEACHGPGRAHVDTEGTAPLGGLTPAHAVECVVEPTCRTCHTDVRDPGWELAPRLTGIHPAEN